MLLKIGDVWILFIIDDIQTLKMIQRAGYNCENLRDFFNHII